MVQILLLLIYISDILLTPLFGVHPLLIILPAIIATLTLYMFLKRVSTRTSCWVATIIILIAGSSWPFRLNTPIGLRYNASCLVNYWQ